MHQIFSRICLVTFWATFPIVVIVVEPVIIYSFVKDVCDRGERVKTLIKTKQDDLFALFVCQTADNCNNHYFGHFFLSKRIPQTKWAY